MDMGSWKNILLQWISECGFAECNFFNLEQSDIEKFYMNFSKKHHEIASSKCPELWDFLQQFYPEFEVNRDDNNGLSSADYIYVYTLLLHFSCVKRPQTFFHDICQKLPSDSQQSMAQFFHELLEMEQLNKVNLREAVAEVIASHALSRSNHSISRSNDSLTPGTSIETDSPLKTPKRNIGARRNLLLTPKTHLLEERTRELFALRAQLDTERYEKDLLEIQIKQNEDKVLRLSQDHKKLIQQIQELKIDVLVKTTDENNSSVDREGVERDQAQKRLVKEITQKDNEIVKLSETLRATEEDKILAEEKLTYNEWQIEMYGERIDLLECEMNDLAEEIQKRDSTIKYLNDAKVELEQFIAEMRVVGLKASIEVDSSFSPATEVFSQSTPPEPESLAASVIDKQLREKEHENAQLRAELHRLNANNKLFAERLKEMIKLKMNEFKITSDLHDYDLETDKCDPTAQFNIFASCMEKINMHHQLEKNKIKSLEQEIVVSQKKNLELARKLDSVLQDANLLKYDLNAFEHNNKELEETKKRLQNSLSNCEAELKNLKEQVTDSEKIKESSTKEINALKTKLHQTENINAKLMDCNAQLKEQLDGLQTKLQELQEKWMTQTKCLEEQIKALNDQLQNQSKELQAFQDAEIALKRNYEQILIRNELFKENWREATEHSNTMCNELRSKEKEMSGLDVQISNLTMKNSDLAKRIDVLMQEYKQEKQQLQRNQDQGLERIKELDNEIFKLNEELAHMRTILENSESQGTHLSQTLEQLQRKGTELLKLCSGNSMPDSSVDAFEELEYHIKSLVEQNSTKAARLETLEVTQKESNSRLNYLLKQVQEKERVLDQRSSTCEELLVLRAQNIEYEDKIEKLKVNQSQFIEQIKSDLDKKENELHQQMEEAKLEHEQRLKELNKELILEREHKTNKERELLLVTAEHMGIKSRLNDAEKEVRTLQEVNGRIRINCERLHSFEKRVIESCEGNERLELEIHTFKYEISKKAQYLIDSDKAMCKLMEEVKNFDYLKKQIKDLQGCLNQGIKAREIIDKVLTEHKHISEEKLQERLNEQSQALNIFNDKLTKVTSEIERLLGESTPFVLQIQREQEEESILPSSLKNSADQMGANVQGEGSRGENLERLNDELKSQLESLPQQNENLPSKLSERENDYRPLFEEQEQVREDSQEKLCTLMRKLAESCDKLESYDVALRDMVVVIRNNINLTAQKDEIKNIFNACADSSECGINQLRHWLNRLLYIQSVQDSKIEELQQKEDQNLNLKEELINENQDLKCKLERNQKKVQDMRKQMENKDSIMQKRLKVEVKGFEEEILKLEKMHEREEGTLQSDADKVISGNEIKYPKADLLRANENVSQLIQQIDSIRMEKEGVCEENQLLRKQLEEVGKHCTTSETKLQSFIERCQSWERHLSASQNELRNAKTNLEKSETNIEKLTNENKKLCESHQATTKRVESMALKLSNAQTRSIELERDNEKLCKTLEANLTTAETLQKEKDLLQSEASALKERLLRAERGHVQLLAKVQDLEHINRTLQDAKQKSDTADIDGKTKIDKLEKVNASNEEKVRKLTASLNSSERSNVKLNLEIGALNSQFQKLSSELSAKYEAQTEQIQRHLFRAQEQAQKYAELNQNLTNQINGLQDQSAKIDHQLSKVSLLVRISKERCDNLCTEVEQLRAGLLVLREAKAKAEREKEIIKQSLKEMHAQNEQLMRERDSLAESLEDQIKRKTKEVESMQNELKQLREKAESQSSELIEGEKVTATNVVEREELRTLLSNMNEALEKEQQLNEHLRSDNQLLHDKCQEAKQHAAEATVDGGERVKGNRLELEKILEKMKAKIKRILRK
ncbi:myosin-13-like [Glossina fuscipes]|uniref:Myosin-13-like n=1 Tax=Glossina fuscipes TaxID=7396 RepID=A0A9C6DZA4_9MUSC|nr:myosin-13-like [Glossina fuscipes]KAI9576129.1 hypothetical protein GQX74_014612 [Glossina fuscipes]